MMVSATVTGCETATACDAPGTSVAERAPARSAMNRISSAGMLWSASPNTNHDGRVRHAGSAACRASVRAASVAGRWVAAMRAVRSASTSAANCSPNTSGRIASSLPPVETG